MNLDLKGKTAVVCGSTDGIGKATARELANYGASIILIARNEAKLKDTLELLSVKDGQKHHYLVADFDDPSALKETLENASKKITSVEILVNNSGGPAGGKAIDANLDEYRLAFNRHLICNQILAQAFVPLMKKSGYGRIVNIISTSVKAPLPGLGVSNTIRGAVANWSKTLANELGGFGITVNNVLPGATQTLRLESIIKNKASKLGKLEIDIEKEMLAEIPANRFASPEETAAAIMFLVSPSAGYINGINLPVDGGRLASL
ncbi:SDR family oxidoreductase [Fulvivirga lutea]|uniref:SDR family oxidoreductase n=1 Tax=Fulvivirga lutea TaxID=2810512 RepID=A0A974WLE6_9BACT|nr:SDR family oxidoreductase [Fulvivirga lutea]QSE97533.1 SDR family oxidoreductase [Fulvivirga lutea]